MSASSLPSSSATVGGEPSYVSVASARPSPPASSAKVVASISTTSILASTSSPPAARLASVHGSEGVAGRVPAADPAERSIALADRARVLARELRPGGEKPPDDAVEVGATRRRRALDDGQAVGCEHERGQLVAEALRSVESLAVEPDRPRDRGASGSCRSRRRSRHASPRARCAPRPRRSGSSARRAWPEARTPGSPRGAPRGDSSSPRRSRRAAGRHRARARARERRTSGSRGA